MLAPLSPKSRAALRSGAGCASASPSGGCFQAYVSLIAFAYLLTLVETEAAGRAYATYGGIYIVASLGLALDGRECAPGSLGHHGRFRLPDRRCGHSLGTARVTLCLPWRAPASRSIT